MNEFKILSKEKILKNIEKLSIEELSIYKTELSQISKNIDLEIKIRKSKIEIAEKFFKKN